MAIQKLPSPEKRDKDPDKALLGGVALTDPAARRRIETDYAIGSLHTAMLSMPTRRKRRR